MPTNPLTAAPLARWKFWLVAILLFVGTFFFNALRTGNLSLLNNDDARFSEASREMLERGDWIVPYFNGQFRFDKPPLIYWCQAPIMALLGQNEFSVRLHSVLSGAFLAVIIFWFGMRMSRPVVGFWAAIIFTTSLRVAMVAKAATSDMLLTLFATLAFWAGWELLRDRVKADSTVESPRGWHSGWWWMFYVSLAIAFLAKGPAGWMPLFALPFYRWWVKPVGMNQRFRFELGLPLMVGLIAIWAAPAYIRTHGEFLRVGVGEHIVTRMTQGYDGHGSTSGWMYLLQSPYYFIYIFGSMIGWSIWFPWLYTRLRAEKYFGVNGRYLVVGVLVTFCIWTLGWSRRPHYTLPAFPLIALLFSGLWWRAGRSQWWLAGMTAILIATAVVGTIVAVRIDPGRYPGRDLARRCAPYLHPDSKFGAVDMDQASLVWYFRQYVKDYRHILSSDEAVAFMAKPGPRFCVMELDVAAEKFPTIPADWERVDAATEGFYSGRQRQRFMVTVLIKQ